MLERILVPLDGSPLAGSVLTQVRQLLMQKDSEVILLRVIQHPPSSEADIMEPMETLRAGALEYLATIERGLASQGARVRSRVAEGFPAGAILEAAKKEDATLIAMSTHGRTGLSRWVFGSVTEKVLRASPVPVLAVPSFVEDSPTGARELPFRRIVLPIAAADRSLEALPPVLELAPLTGAQVYLVNVCEGSGCSVEVPQMRKAYDLLHQAGIAADPMMKQGDAATQILETCRETGADLIAMTTHGHSGLSRWMLGSVAEKVLRAARVPMLVVRTAKRASATEPASEAVHYHSHP
jgi:nucleotide-binding universal stress UspA family protein